ncbi:amidohydrolase family protein [Parasphingopyxis lamellibrachiae]|uniref:Imidazolonepropionase-like amidohydrolase n=1 Tax=Parasphingopyxis lamellibrachiae TaxID=680125 RepID=A0A3D9FG57_9SPHN|nr:amidohydrolase family protein [Parasphingopyxis lamellibrachiae]RED16081.1 imidazolonepropionase-like amidohydrolase [Parasphingopyxis lamellibrachiae]
MKALLALLATLYFATPAAAQTVAITGGTVVIGDGADPVPGGTVVVRDGRIVAAGANVAVPAGAQIVDATGQWVTPGIVGGFTRLGLVEVGAVSSTNDSSAADSDFSAGLDVAPAINPLSAAIATNRTGGVTRAVVAPETANTIFGGQGAVIDLGADMDAVMRPRAFQFVELGERGAARAGGSRSASHASFRNALDQALIYARNPAAYGGQSSDSLLNRVDAAALVPVVQGRIPLVVHVEQARDILSVIALRTDYPRLNIILVGVSEGWTVAPQIAAAGIPVIASALNDLPAQFEQLAATQSNIGRMRDAGVQVAIGMIDDNDAHQIRYSTQYAGNLVALNNVPGATGLSWGEAFAAISSWPAEIMGLGNEIGSLRPGRRADIVIWDGDPLELSSNVDVMLIDGVQQPLTSRQTRLRDRYLSIDEQQLPQAFEW